MSNVIDILSQIIGRPVWGSKRTNGSSFLIQIGEPRLYVREASDDAAVRLRSPLLARRRISPVGEFKLLIVDCDWEISNGDMKSNLFSVIDIENAIESINGHYIDSVKIDYDRPGKVVIVLDGNKELSVTPNLNAGDQD